MANDDREWKFAPPHRRLFYLDRLIGYIEQPPRLRRLIVFIVIRPRPDQIALASTNRLRSLRTSLVSDIVVIINSSRDVSPPASNFLQYRFAAFARKRDRVRVFPSERPPILAFSQSEWTSFVVKHANWTIDSSKS